MKEVSHTSLTGCYSCLGAVYFLYGLGAFVMAVGRYRIGGVGEGLFSIHQIYRVSYGYLHNTP